MGIFFSAQSAPSPSGGVASPLNQIAAAPDPKTCLVPPRGADSFRRGVLNLVKDLVGFSGAAITESDIVRMARLDQARECAKLSVTSKGPELPSWLSSKSNSRNGDVYDAKKQLILAVQNLAERRNSFNSVLARADGNNALLQQRSTLESGTAQVGDLTPYQSSLLREQQLVVDAEGRCTKARERVVLLTLKVRNGLQSQPR